jgi:CheY-like chemotaxis protein
MSKLSNIKILLVDDDANVRSLLKEHLIGHGGLVAEASDGQKAFDKIQSHDFDVVVSDLRGPNKSGADLMSLIRTYSGKAPRMIFMSSFEDISSNKAIEKGDEELYLKPKNVQDLIDLIKDD